MTKIISPIYLSEAIDMLLKLKDARIHTYDEIKMYETITDMLIDCKTAWSETTEILEKELEEKYFRSLSDE
tara:strand:- start:27 stop:239 length:213 start_codon:yes stop_codon:yes gene_type:complete